MDIPGLPSSLPTPSVVPKGAKVLVHAVAVEHGGELQPCGGVDEDGQVRTQGGLLSVSASSAKDYDGRDGVATLDTKLPPASVWLVVAVGTGERLHGEYATPNAEVGDVVALARDVTPQTNALTGPMQGLVFDHEIVCAWPTKFTPRRFQRRARPLEADVAEAVP